MAKTKKQFWGLLRTPMRINALKKKVLHYRVKKMANSPFEENCLNPDCKKKLKSERQFNGFCERCEFEMLR